MYMVKFLMNGALLSPRVMKLEWGLKAGPQQLYDPPSSLPFLQAE